MATKAGFSKLKEQEKDFTWTDDEIQLLLEVVVSFKSTCDYKDVCLESIRTKNDQIRDIVVTVVLLSDVSTGNSK